MKRLFSIAFLSLLLCLLLVSCKNKKETTTTEEETQDQQSEMAEANESEVKEVTVDRSYHFRDTDPYEIDTMWMVQDTLHIKVQYGGGCEPHEFELMSNGAYAKSMPPQMTLHLEHENNDDMCRGLITEELKFDLTPIRNPSTEKLIVRVNGLKIDPVTYTYKR